MNWDEVSSKTQALAEEIRVRFGAPDAIVAIARGGWIPARLLASELGVSRLYNLGLTYSDRERSRLEVYQSANFSHLKVVLVEDAVESGRSLRYAKQLLQELGNEVLSAALINIDTAGYSPDAYVESLLEVPLFPWE